MWKKLHFLQSPHQVDMKNAVEWQKELFAYSNSLETYGVAWQGCLKTILQKKNVEDIKFDVVSYENVPK